MIFHVTPSRRRAASSFHATIFRRYAPRARSARIIAMPYLFILLIDVSARVRDEAYVYARFFERV